MMMTRRVGMLASSQITTGWPAGRPQRAYLIRHLTPTTLLLSSDEPVSRPAAAHTHQANTVPEEDLLQIKTQALQSLAPLVGHLDQSPEEKFKTTMMMIQASDNADLIRDAYQAAKSIVDEKARAQALLDIINEINYFTQRGKN